MFIYKLLSQIVLKRLIIGFYKGCILCSFILLTGPKKPTVRENRILGQLKLTLHYQRGAFMVN